jgi:flagellar hook-associated protein 3 FlgL
MRAVESTFPNELARTVSELGVRQARLQTQASTGQRIRNPEDDPSAFRNVLELQGSLQQLGQYSDNVQKLQDRSSASYDAVSQLKRVNDRASEIATAAVSIRTADDYAAYAAEVNQLIESALGLANSKLHGESLFSGTSGSPLAFQATRDGDGDISQVTYTGNASVRNVEISEGVTAKMDILGANTSDSSGARGLLLDKRAGIDVFGHLIALRDALHAGDQKAISSAAEGLAKDETGYIQSFAEIGADQGRLESAGRQNDAMAVSLNQMISQESDVDLAQTLVELNQLQAAYSAALQSAGKILRLSLLDYI